MPEITSTPTLNKSDIKGWETRLIFSQNIPEYLDITSSDYFSVISPNLTRGTLGYFPAKYWSQGRVLRLKANLTYGNAGKLDIQTQITDFNNSIACRQNNGQEHVFAGGNGPSNVPVSLEITYVRAGSDNGFGMSGFYQYEWGSYDSGGGNSKVVYVPMNYVYDSIIDFSAPTQIGLIINNGPVVVNWMTIEELG